MSDKFCRVVVVGILAGWLSVGWGAEELTGIAAVIKKQDERLVLVDVLPDGPAETAGLLAGDELLSIDGVAVGEYSLEELATMLRGEPFSTVELSVRRDAGPVPVTYRVMRKTFEIPADAATTAPALVP